MDISRSFVAIAIAIAILPNILVLNFLNGRQYNIRIQNRHWAHLYCNCYTHKQTCTYMYMYTLITVSWQTNVLSVYRCWWVIKDRHSKDIYTYTCARVLTHMYVQVHKSTLKFYIVRYIYSRTNQQLCDQHKYTRKMRICDNFMRNFCHQ